MKRSLVATALAVGLLCLGGSPAWASPSATPDVQWSYNFTPNQQFVNGNPGGSVSFTSQPTLNATNNSDVVVTNLKVSSTATADSPDTLSSAGWSVGLKLTDVASNTSDTMLFGGKLSGSFSADFSNITNTPNSGESSYTWTAPSGNQYKVTLDGYTPPGPPSQTNLGSISAHVQVTPADGTISGGGGGTTPEPSTLVLSCLGLGFAGLTSWRKRRRCLAALLA